MMFYNNSSIMMVIIWLFIERTIYRERKYIQIVCFEYTVNNECLPNDKLLLCCFSLIDFPCRFRSIMSIIVIRIITVSDSTAAITIATIFTVSSLVLPTSEKALVGCAGVVWNAVLLMLLWLDIVPYRV